MRYLVIKVGDFEVSKGQFKFHFFMHRGHFTTDSLKMPKKETVKFTYDIYRDDIRVGGIMFYPLSVSPSVRLFVRPFVPPKFNIG